MYKFLFVFFICFPLFAQNFDGGFNFLLSPYDTITAKFLPEFKTKKLTDKDFVAVNSTGNFAVEGKPIKFWGTNCVSSGAFPDKSKAWFIAGRLRKFGFNMVRFHHMDNNWGTGLMQSGKDTRHLDPVALDKLDYFLSELKNNGIYADINLHVSRTFNKLDGVPQADSIVDYGKGVTIFDPQLIALQKEYALQLLTHVNPYTGLALVNDPVMGVLEITNENSLYRMWRSGTLKPFASGGSLTIRHIKMLDSAFNKYLSNKYGSTAALKTEWNKETIPLSSANLILNGDFETAPINTNWIMELHDTAAAVMAKDNSNPYQGKYSAKVTVTKVTSTDWHIQWKQTGFTVKKDSLYLIEFAARADSACTISATVMRDNDPYNGYGNQSFKITSQWQVYSFTIKPSEDNSGKTRLSFSFGNRKGNYWFDNIKITSTGLKGLLANETIEAGNIKRLDYGECISYTPARVKDISAFYIKLQDDYFADMMKYLKNSLGVKVPISGTNWNIGPGDLITQSNFDFLDNHSYWDHPSFPNIPWSSTDWTISNKPMVKSSTGGIIPWLFGGVPFKGKPFTVSEYNHGFPNRYQTESLLFLTSYGAFNDADALMFFDYNGGSDWEADRVSGYFDIHRNSAYMSLSPSCAYAYRNCLIAKDNSPIYLKYKRDDVYLLPKNDNGNWQGQNKFNWSLALKYAVKNEDFNSSSTTDFSLLPTLPVNPFKTTTNEITYNTNGILTTETKNFIAAAGFLNEFSNLKIGNMQIKSATDFGVVTWLSLNSDSLAVTNKSLITISSKVQNSSMLWDGINTVHNNWGTAPTLMYPLKVSFSIKIFADSIRIYTLDTKGLEKGFITVFPSNQNTFDFSIDQNVSKSLWFGLETFGKGGLVPVNDIRQKTLNYNIEQNYPNPFNPVTIINYSLANPGNVCIKVFNAIGQQVSVLENTYKLAGKYSVLFDASKLSNGIYYYQIISGEFTRVKKAILLK